MATSQKSLASPRSAFTSRIALFVSTLLALLTVAHLASTLHAQSVADELITRTFKLNPTNLRKSIPRFVLSCEAPQVFREDSFATSTEDLRSRFGSVGVEFENDPLSAGALPTEKAMFLNERTGELIIRAARRDMPKIEAVLASYVPQPPQVEVEAKFAEIPASNPIPLTLQRPSPPSTMSNLTILTERQFRVTLKKLEDQAGVDVITPPNVITISGRKARIQVEHARPVLYQTPPDLPWDTSPDADPTPHNKGRLPFPPTFSADKSLIIRGQSDF